MTSTTKVNKGSGKLSSRRFKTMLIEIIMILVTAVVLYPFLIMIFVSLKSTKEALISPNTFPSEFHFENFVKAWQIMGYEKVFLNTLIITAVSLLESWYFRAWPLIF